jgi:NAD(P)-dependent dehydrogenase (short-subunit alcohol dehydrogenase family)
MTRLTGLTCLVTGSTGIAATAAHRFAAEGARVFVTSRTPDHVAALVESLAASGAEAAGRPADVTVEAEVEAAVSACADRFGRIDGLLSVAGGGGRRYGDGPIDRMTAEAWDRTLELNLRSQALVAGAVVRRMLDQAVSGAGSRGSVVLVSSTLAFAPAPPYFETHAYAAAKGGIISLARSMAASYATRGIRVNVLAPAVTDTSMAERASGDPEITTYLRHKQPLTGGLLSPDDVASAAVFLLADESRAVTGQVLAIDGGWSVTSVGPEAVR